MSREPPNGGTHDRRARPRGAPVGLDDKPATRIDRMDATPIWGCSQGRIYP